MIPTSLAYMACPISDNNPAKLAQARRWLKALQTANPRVVMIAPWITLCETHHGASPALWKIRHAVECFVIVRCDAVVLVGGTISTDMQEAAKAAEAYGKIVYDLTHLGEEPPNQILLKATVSL